MPKGYFYLEKMLREFMNTNIGDEFSVQYRKYFYVSHYLRPYVERIPEEHKWRLVHRTPVPRPVYDELMQRYLKLKTQYDELDKRCRNLLSRISDLESRLEMFRELENRLEHPSNILEMVIK